MRPAEYLLNVRGCLSRHSNTGLVVPKRGAHVASLVQSFIDHIPRKDLSCVVFHHSRDVIVQKPRQLSGLEVAKRQPVRIITAPDQAMSADCHLMGASKPNHFVALAKIITGCVWP